MPVKPPLIAQERLDTCAIACFRMILAFHGRVISEPELIRSVAMEAGGLDIEELARLGRNLGLDAKIQELDVAGIAGLIRRGIFPIVYLNRIHLDRRFPVNRRIALRLFLPHAVIPDNWYWEAFDELEAQGHLDPASSKLNGGDAAARLSANGRYFLRHGDNE